MFLLSGVEPCATELFLVTADSHMQPLYCESVSVLHPRVVNYKMNMGTYEAGSLFVTLTNGGEVKGIPLRTPRLGDSHPSVFSMATQMGKI